MSNHDQAIALSANERGKIRETVLSELDATRDRLARTIDSLLNAVPEGAERTALLARLEAEQQKVAQLRRECLERLAHSLPVSPGTEPVDLGQVEAAVLFKYADYRVVGSDDAQPPCEAPCLSLSAAIARFAAGVQAGPSFDALQSVSRVLAIFERGGSRKLLKSLQRRTQAARRQRIHACRPVPPPRPIGTRSTSSRSRTLAPLTAPPSVC